MVNQRLVDWIKSEKAQGCSEIALTKTLVDKKYSLKEIREAFNSLKDNNPLSIAISFVLLVGLGFISLLLVAVILAIASFFAGKSMGYFLIILSGVGMSYYIHYIRQKLNATEQLGVIFGIFSPISSLILILAALTIIQKVSEQLSALATVDGQSVTGISEMLNVFLPGMNPIVAAVLFYLGCNLFMILSITKSKEYRALIWYLIAPVVFFVVWLVVDLFVSKILMNSV